MGRLLGTTTTYSFLPGHNFQNAYTYDAASNRTSLTAPDTSITTYGYDTLNRLNGMANSWAGSFGFSYDALSRRTQLTRPNGINTNYGYDAVSHLLSVLHQAGTTTLDGASYTYDLAGNRTSKGNYLNGVTSNYGYDPLYELSQVTQGGSTTESYSYDAVGNRLSSVGVPLYNYNPSNELTSNSSGSYTYDNNGSTLTDASGKSYTWDFENRMVQAVVPGTNGGTTTFKYDPFGRRIQKSGPLGTTNYLYDGSNVIEEADNAANVLARYVFGPKTDEPLAESRSGTTAYHGADPLGSVTSLTSSAGALTKTYIYDSFGNLAASTGSLVNPFQYTGRESDPETGVYYYRARYYDENTGRFLSEDPMKFASGAIDFYAYAWNSPANFNDPTGLAACCQRNIDEGKRELERALNNAQIMGQGVFQKYKKCLLKFPDMKIDCDPKDKGCGHHGATTFGTLVISPLGSLGRKGKCGPVASTFLHELIHECYGDDLTGTMLTPLDQEREAFQGECQMFGYGCACAQDPKKCGY